MSTFIARIINLPTDGTSKFGLDFTGPAVNLRNVDGRKAIYYSSDGTTIVTDEDERCVLAPGDKTSIAIDSGATVTIWFWSPAWAGTTGAVAKLEVVGFQP